VRSYGYEIDSEFATENYSPRPAARPVRSSFWLRLFRCHLREWLVVIAAGFAVAMIIVNALFLQTGPHPAPIFSNHAATAPERPMILPRPRPAGAGESTSAVPARSRTEIVAAIQRELAQRGFYDGPNDGSYSAKTDIAIRDFEDAAQLRPSTEPNEALLRVIAHSALKSPPVVPSNDPIGSLLAPSKRVIAIQRALATFGYGQIKPTGAYDPETRIAIEAFERNRKLPVTGQISDRVTRELAAMTGRPLE
jgi:peptidoglycan hydrolase-like protein with peptidoglycan-binding domain